MTYLQFLLLFLLLPIVFLATWQKVWGGRSPGGVYFRIGIIAAIALLYTTPWDNYVIAIASAIHR